MAREGQSSQGPSTLGVVLHLDTAFNTHDQLAKGNIAVGIVVGSIFVGLGIAIGLVIGMGLN